MSNEPSERLELRVANLDCDQEAALIQRGLEGMPGLAAVEIDPETARVRLRFDPALVQPPELRARLAELGFPPHEAPAAVPQPGLWRSARVRTSLASGLLLLAAWLGGKLGLPAGLELALDIAAMLIGGFFFGREAFEELIREREVGIELLMSVAAVTALLLGQATEGAALVFLYSISEALEGYTVDKTRASINALLKLTPRLARVRRAGLEMDIPVEQIDVGDVFIVNPGQALPTDGTVLVGQSAVNQASVTGESIPVEVGHGDPVLAGSINGDGALEVRATRIYADNTISRIIALVEEAQEKKGRSQRLIERFGRRYSPAVLGVALLVAAVPPLLFGAAWSTWISRAAVFIVAASPCALVISVPVSLIAALGTGARQGVLFKGGVYLEELARARVVALDKTGTLTSGEPRVTDIIALPYGPDRILLAENELLAAAAGIESRSSHPLARAIARYAHSRQVKPSVLSGYRSMTGSGAAGLLQDRPIYAGSLDLFRARLDLPLAEIQEQVDALQAEGKTAVLVGDDRAVWGLIALRDTPRPNARQAVDALRQAGLTRIVMLSGDNERAAQAAADELGITSVHANLGPADKARLVRDLTAAHGHVVMVGDGVNDAPAMAEASVGVAMGAAGSDVALETADVALMADNLEKLAYGYGLARRTRRIILQNLAFSLAVIAFFIIGATAGWFTLTAVILAHEGSEFLVIANGMRLLKA
ncbi:MAG: heavy metal translocating P-type ATPase [Anaerolineae bacterium]